MWFSLASGQKGKNTSAQWPVERRGLRDSNNESKFIDKAVQFKSPCFVFTQSLFMFFFQLFSRLCFSWIIIN